MRGLNFHPIGRVGMVLLTVVVWVGAVTGGVASRSVQAATDAWSLPATPIPAMPSNYFSGASQASLINFQQCQAGQTISAIEAFGEMLGQSQSFSAALQGMQGVSLTTPCPAGGDMPTEGASCQDLRDASGRCNDRAFQGLVKANQSSMAQVACEQMKLRLLQRQLSCFQGQAALWMQQIQALQAQYVQNISAMQNFSKQLDVLHADREEQYGKVQKILNGDPSTGRPGINQLITETQALVEGMNDEATQVYAMFDQLEQQEKSIEEIVEIRTAGLARQCFAQRKLPQRYCLVQKQLPDGRVVSEKVSATAAEYIRCVYRDSFYVDQDGKRRERHTRVDAQAQTGQGDIEGVLEKILADMPENAEPPAVADDPASLAKASAGFGGQSVRVRSYADLERRYGDLLKNYRGNPQGRSVDVRGFVLATMKSCFSKAQSQVTSERTKENSVFGPMQRHLRVKKEAAHNQIEKILTRYSGAYQKITDGLTGNFIPLPVAKCRNSYDPKQNMACIQAVKRTFEQALLSDDPELVKRYSSGTVMTITGHTNATIFSFTCYGLTGCKTMLANASNKLEEEGRRIQVVKKNSVDQFNASVKSYTEGVRRLTEPQVAMLNQQLGQMNQVLTSMGVTPTMEFPPVPTEEWEVGPDGVLMPPKNLVGLVSRGFSPPMPDVNGTTVGQALAGVAAKSTELQARLSNSVKFSVNLMRLASECPAQERQDAVAGMHEALDGWSTSKCQYVVGQVECRNRFSKFVEDVGDAVGGDFDFDASGLSIGVADLCSVDPDVEIDQSALKDKDVLLKDLQANRSFCQRAADRMEEKFSQKKALPGDVVGVVTEAKFPGDSQAKSVCLDSLKAYYQTDPGTRTGASLAGYDGKRAELSTAIKEGRSSLGEFSKVSANSCMAYARQIKGRSQQLKDIEQRRANAGAAIGM